MRDVLHILKIGLYPDTRDTVIVEPMVHPVKEKTVNYRELLKKNTTVLSILGLVALTAVTFSIAASRNSTDTRSKAAVGQNTNVVFVDQYGTPVTEAATPMVYVKLTSPWAATSASAAMEVDPAVAGAETVLGQSTVTLQVKNATDDVNEDGSSFISSGNVWLGTGQNRTGSWTGLRFENVQIPRNAVIKSAKLSFYSAQSQWINTRFIAYADDTADSTTFSSTSKPSQRVRTSNSVSHNSNTRWNANQWYALNEMRSVVQEVINRSDWQSGNDLSVLLKGSGSTYARKFARSFDQSSSNAPRLTITYATADVTTAPTATATRVPTSTTIPTATKVPPTATKIPPPTATNTPTPKPYTVSVELAEDSEFTKNYVKHTYSTHPLTVPYTFSNSTAGQKTIYARFKSSNGQTQVFSNWIDLTTPVTVAPTGSHTGGTSGDESMAMHAWRVGGKNSPNSKYDKCDDGTDVVAAHNQYYVIAYDGKKYPTWHPSVVTNPVTGAGKCYFGHEHGSNPQGYIHWNKVYEHFGKDVNNDGKITPLTISNEGQITEGDRAGLPFGIANDHMDQYYNQENRDSLFVRHEDHVGHKIEFVNMESDMVGNTTHPMSQLNGTQGINVPYYTTGQETYKATGVVCTHLHKFHQGTHSGDAIMNNLHETIFHSDCMSTPINGVDTPSLYPNNEVLLTGMMAFGKPGEYVRFCFADRFTKVCPEGKNPDGSCVINDPLISKLPDAINSNSLGRNMVDRYCYENFSTLNPGSNYFAPYELWEGDLRIQKADGDMLAEHGRQWDVLDPIRFVDPKSPTGFSYNAEQCAPGGAFDGIQFIGGCYSREQNVPWDSPQSGFRGLKRTTYFGRNHVSNRGGSEVWWTDPLGGNAVTTQFPSGLKQKISSVDADIQRVQSRIQQVYGTNNFLNDRAIQRTFNSGGNTVHAPN